MPTPKYSLVAVKKGQKRKVNPFYRKKKPAVKAAVAAVKQPRVAKKIVQAGLDTKEKRFEVNENFDCHTVHTNNTKHKEICSIAIGDERDERISNTIYMTGVQLRIAAQCQTSQTDIFGLRILCVRLNRDDSLPLTGSTYDGMYSSYNYSKTYPDPSHKGQVQLPNTDSYQLLWQKFYRIYGSDSGTKDGSKKIQFFKRMNRKITYVKGSTDPRQPIVLLFHCVNLGNNTSTNVLEADGMIRVFYKDM